MEGDEIQTQRWFHARHRLSADGGRSDTFRRFSLGDFACRVEKSKHNADQTHRLDSILILGFMNDIACPKAADAMKHAAASRHVVSLAGWRDPNTTDI